MILPRVFNTVFLSPITKPTETTYIKNLVLIGTSEKGTYMEPIFMGTPKEAISNYGSGRLVDAYKEAYDSGSRFIYLLRINQDGESLSKDQTYERLATAYDLLSHFEAHIIVPLDVSLDDPASVGNFATQLVDFLKNKQYQKAIGVIGIKQKADEISWDQFISDLLKDPVMTTGFEEIVDGDIVDYGQNMAVVMSESIFNINLSNEYAANGAAAYGGLISSLDSNISPTNKPLLGVGSVKDILGSGTLTQTITLSDQPYRLAKFPESQPKVMFGDAELTVDVDFLVNYDDWTIQGLGSSIGKQVSVIYPYDDCNSLVLAGYTVFRLNRRRGYVPARAVTAASLKSSWYGISNVRVVHEIVSIIQDISQDWIGESITDPRIIEDRIEQRLALFKAEGKLAGYVVEVEFPTPDQAEVDLDLTPVGEILGIHTQVRLRV
jgi:hypothetical protein